MDLLLYFLIFIFYLIFFFYYCIKSVFYTLETETVKGQYIFTQNIGGLCVWVRRAET